jgi:hypothetical protein
MGLRDEWNAIRDAVERVAVDVTRLTTITRHHVVGTEVARIRAEVQLDGDTTTHVRGSAGDLASCHRAAVTFTSELAAARLRMIARVAKALLS